MSAKPDPVSRLQAKQQALWARHHLTGEIRRFFRERDFLEVETPVRVLAPALEDHIDAIPSGSAFLRTSPELHMKKLLAAGCPRLFQLGPCFRAGERGTLHTPEFTMLEWYRAHADCWTILDDTMALVRNTATALNGEARCVPHGRKAVELAGEWERLSVDEAFARYANTDVDAAVAAGMYETVLVEKIEPHLGNERPTVLYDFPAALGSLARSKPGNPRRVERWELYIAGIELANAYTEITDYNEQIRRFDASARLRQEHGRCIYPLDEEYLQLLRDRQYPESGGIALGVDRLLMVLAGLARIDDAVAFIDEP